MTIDLSVRSDTGKINQSPVSSVASTIILSQTCSSSDLTFYIPGKRCILICGLQFYDIISDMGSYNVSILICSYYDLISTSLNLWIVWFLVINNYTIQYDLAPRTYDLNYFVCTTHYLLLTTYHLVRRTYYLIPTTF